MGPAALCRFHAVPVATSFDPRDPFFSQSRGLAEATCILFFSIAFHAQFLFIFAPVGPLSPPFLKTLDNDDQY